VRPGLDVRAEPSEGGVWSTRRARARLQSRAVGTWRQVALATSGTDATLAHFHAAGMRCPRLALALTVWSGDYYVQVIRRPDLV